MRRSLFFSILLSSLPGICLFSQGAEQKYYPDQPLRIEIPAQSVNETYRIIPLGEEGLIMFFRSQEHEDDQRTNWYFTCYDTNFQQVWVKNVPLYNDQVFRFHNAGRDTLALLFVHGGKSKNAEDVFEILRIIPREGMLILNAGALPNGASVDAFSIRHGRAWLGINHGGQAGTILTIGLQQGYSRSFTLGVGSQITLLWMHPDTNAVTISAIVSRQVSKKSTEYFLVRYDTAGLIKREVPVGLQDVERSLTNTRVAAPGTGSELLLGSYRQGPPTAGQRGRQADESTGLFAGSIMGNAQMDIKFYNFLDFQNISSLVGENDIISLKKKALKKQKSLGEYSLDLSLLLHEPFIMNNQFVVTAEVFAPQYHTENFTDYDFYGRPYTNSYSVFDGYRYYSAFVAGFDNDGRLLWDNNIEIRNLVSPELSPKVVIYPDSGELVMCYVSDGKIGSKIVMENAVTAKLDFNAIDMLYPEDKLLAETKGGLLHWYGRYFLSYGYQEVKNIALESNNKRLVFYFTKLHFEK